MSTIDTVLIATRRLYAAFHARDIKAMEAVWAEDVAVTCIDPGWNAIEGRAEVLKSWPPSSRTRTRRASAAMRRRPMCTAAPPS